MIMSSIAIRGKAHAIYMDASSNSFKEAKHKGLFTWMITKRKKLARVPRYICGNEEEKQQEANEGPNSICSVKSRQI